MAYYISHDSFISGAGKETYGDKKQEGKRRKYEFSDNKEAETENNLIKQALSRKDSKKIPQKAVSCEENRQQELITVEVGPSESLTFCKVNKSLKKPEAATTVEFTESQSEEHSNTEGMKTEIYVKIETVENITLTLRESDRKLATPLCVEEENNDKECKADYDDSDVRQKRDSFSDIIDGKQKKKEASSQASEIKNDNDENTLENLIEKSNEVSTHNKTTHSHSKVFNDQSFDETNEQSANNEKIKVSDKENEGGNVGDDYEDLSDIESSNSSQTKSIYNHQEKEYEAILLGQEIELLADTNENKVHNIEYNDLKTETGKINETEDIEERKEENGIGEPEEPAGNSDIQIESVYKEKATNVVEANESGIIADDTEDCEIIPNEPKNTGLNNNSDDERNEQKEDSNIDLEITMDTTIEELKLHFEEQKTITDVTCNKEKATNMVEANESGIIADETEDCEIIPNEPKNTSLNNNSDDERNEQKEDLNIDLEITMDTTNEELKFHSEEQETITDVTCNTELSKENNEVTFENCLLDSKTETGEMDETEDIEEKEGNEISETEEPAENNDFQIESVYKEKATNLVGANESGNIADETEDYEIIPNELKNKILNKNSDDERKEKKEESNIDLGIKMNTTNEEMKLHTEQQKTMTDVTCNTELSEENNEVIFENCLLDSKAEKFEQVESNMNGFVMETSEECDDHNSCQENLKNIKMDEDDTPTTLANVFGSEEIRNGAKETMLVFDNSIAETAQLLEVNFMENDVLDTNLSGEEDNIEENKEDLFKEITSKRKVLSTDKDFEHIESVGNVNHRHNTFKDQAKDDKNVNTIFKESRPEMEEIIESTTKNGPETESINATKSINSNTELLLEISVDNDEQKEASQYYQHKTYSDESFKDELIFAASIVAEEAGDAGHDWKEEKRGKYLEIGRNWLKTEGTKSRKPHEANHLQSPILSWLPIILLIMIMSYMAIMVMRLVDEKKEYTNEVSVQEKDDLLDQFAYFDIMKWP